MQSQMQTLPQKGNLLDDLAVVSNSMKEYIDNDSDAVLSTIVARMNKAPSMWRKIFPSAFDREQDKVALDQFKTAYKDRRALLDAFVATQLEIAKRRGDAFVVAVSVDLQAKLAAFATLKMDDLTRSLFTSKDEFYARAAEHWRNLEGYRDISEIYELARQSCAQEIRSFLSFVETLRENFTAALQAKVAGKER